MMSGNKFDYITGVQIYQFDEDEWKYIFFRTDVRNGSFLYKEKVVTKMKKDRIYFFLFLGNSYTYYNELWDVFQKAASSAGYSVTVDSVTHGGYYLDQLADPLNPYGAQVEEKLSAQKYDYVFLQEQSTCPLLNNNRFESGAKALLEKIKQNGAACILYQTWGRKTGSNDLTANNWTNESMTRDLAAAYRKLGAKLNIPVSPVGTAFYQIYTAHPEIELYNPDRTHPSAAGTYLAALCHFAVVTGERPTTVSYHGGFSEEQAAFLKRAADDAVFGVITRPCSDFQTE